MSDLYAFSFSIGGQNDIGSTQWPHLLITILPWSLSLWDHFKSNHLRHQWEARDSKMLFLSLGNKKMFVKWDITPVQLEEKTAVVNGQRCSMLMRQMVLKLRSQWRRKLKKLRRSQARFGYDLESYFQNFDDGLQDYGKPVSCAWLQLEWCLWASLVFFGSEVQLGIMSQEGVTLVFFFFVSASSIVFMAWQIFFFCVRCIVQLHLDKSFILGS